MYALNATYTTEAMQARWCDEAVLAAMLRFETELAAAQADCGFIPAAAAQLIAEVAAELRPDPWEIGREAQRASTLAIPLVKSLKAAVAARDPAVAPLVHLGATSQDLVDTALILVAVESLDDLLQQYQQLGNALAELVTQFDATPMLARTLLQPAAPTSFGWKAASWLDAVTRVYRALTQQRNEVAVLQFGGANGTLLVHGVMGQAVASTLAQRLGLGAPAISWHGARDRFARLAAELAIGCGVIGKFGRDVSLLMQAEVAEAFEPAGEGRGGSSAMPHKRNPVAAMHMLDAAYRAPALAQTLAAELPAEHERGLGSWPNALPTFHTLFGLCANSLQAAVETAAGLQVDAAAMQSNIDRMFGVVYSESLNRVVAQHLGTAAAAKLLGSASAEALQSRRHIIDLLVEHADLQGKVTREELEEACSPDQILEGARPMCQAVLNQWQQQFDRSS